ncbi:MAG: hypothetical protein KKA73_07885 [Chloroflexi bacterium]|nr:hypothetical protein [Chloroflexota bacterium]MBU1747593.1 hypothetical protein [Chloroflexota bacterium]
MSPGLLRDPDRWNLICYVRCPDCQELTAYPSPYGRYAPTITCQVCGAEFANPAQGSPDGLG